MMLLDFMQRQAASVALEEDVMARRCHLLALNPNRKDNIAVAFLAVEILKKSGGTRADAIRHAIKRTGLRVNFASINSGWARFARLYEEENGK